MVFNMHVSGLDYMPTVTDHFPGAGTGLSLILNVEQYQYMSGPHSKIGIQVMLSSTSLYQQSSWNKKNPNYL